MIENVPYLKSLASICQYFLIFVVFADTSGPQPFGSGCVDQQITEINGVWVCLLCLRMPPHHETVRK